MLLYKSFLLPVLLFLSPNNPRKLSSFRWRFPPPMPLSFIPVKNSSIVDDCSYIFLLFIAQNCEYFLLFVWGHIFKNSHCSIHSRHSVSLILFFYCLCVWLFDEMLFCPINENLSHYHKNGMILYFTFFLYSIYPSKSFSSTASSFLILFAIITG